MDKRETWYEGAAPGWPSTNNALEGTNNYIKKEFTEGERQTPSEFFETALKIVMTWSEERDPTDPACEHVSDAILCDDN